MYHVIERRAAAQSPQKRSLGSQSLLDSEGDLALLERGLLLDQHLAVAVAQRGDDVLRPSARHHEVAVQAPEALSQTAHALEEEARPMRGAPARPGGRHFEVSGVEAVDACDLAALAAQLARLVQQGVVPDPQVASEPHKTSRIDARSDHSNETK